MKNSAWFIATFLFLAGCSSTPMKPKGIPMGAEYVKPVPVAPVSNFEKPQGEAREVYCSLCDDCTAVRNDGQDRARFILQRRAFLIYILETAKERVRSTHKKAKDLYDLIGFAIAHVKRGSFNLKLGDAPPDGRPVCATDWIQEWNKDGTEVSVQSHDFEQRYYTDPVYYEGHLLREYQLIREGNEKHEAQNRLLAPYTSRSYAAYLQANYYRIVSNQTEREDRRIADMIQAASGGFRSASWAEYMRILSGVDQEIATKHLDCAGAQQDSGQAATGEMMKGCLTEEREVARGAALGLLEASRGLQVDRAGVVWRGGQAIADPEFAREVARGKAKITSYLLALYDGDPERALTRTEGDGVEMRGLAGMHDPEVEGLASQVFSDWSLRALSSCAPEQARDAEVQASSIARYAEWLRMSPVPRPLLNEYHKSCGDGERANPFLKLKD